MKKLNKTFLPDEIEYNGETYKRNSFISIAMGLNNTSESVIASTLKKEGRKCVLVNVLSKNLKGKNDIHGKPYKPTKWIFTNK